MEHLKTQLPDLYRKMVIGPQQVFGNKSESGTVEGRYYRKRSGNGLEFRPRVNGEVTRDSQSAPGGWQPEGLNPKLDLRLLLVGLRDGGVEPIQGAGITLLKIAYEYLALHVGGTIYDDTLNPVREAILGNDQSIFPGKVEWLRGTREPVHMLLVEQTAPNVIVQVRLFGEHVYRIHFSCLRVRATMPKAVYRFDLASKKPSFDWTNK